MKEKEKETIGLIFKKIPAVMADITSIGKGQKNTMQNYKFRGIDDVYNEIHKVLAKHKIFTVPEVIGDRHEERKSKSGGVLLYRVLTIKYSFYAEDGSHVDAVIMGEAMDSGDKAANKAQSVAHKYALLQVFCIPTEETKDPETASPELSGSPKETKSYKAAKGIADMADNPSAGFKTIKLVLSNGKTKAVDKFEALDYFKKVKEALGSDLYYGVLGDFGFEKSNEIPSKQIPEIYATMIDLIQGAEHGN